MARSSKSGLREEIQLICAKMKEADIDFHHRAFTCLCFAKLHEDACLATYFIRGMYAAGCFSNEEIEQTIQWFENLSPLEWEPEAVSFGLECNGHWRLESAYFTDVFDNEEYAPRYRYARAADAEPEWKADRKPDPLPSRRAEHSESDRTAEIYAYISEHPMDDSPMGHLGVPADRRYHHSHKMRTKRS